MTRSIPIAAAVVLAATMPVLAATSSSNKPAASRSTAHSAAKAVKLPDGLTYTDIAVGKGDPAKAGHSVEVDYTGSFPNGSVFDSSKQHGQHFTFALGAHQVIKCWDEGVAGMRAGGTRKLVCPPDLAYGARGAGGVIPPNATLDFTVTLYTIK